MRLVKLITHKKTKTLRCFSLTFLVSFFLSFMPAFAQDNSPYSRFGIGDLVPTSNVNVRGMGGISAGYADYYSINFNNPASYSHFQTILEPKSKKIVSGRAILDVGLNFESHNLYESSPPRTFKTGNALFSYVQVGMPLKKNWGLSFGLRPLSRISYKIFNNQMLKDPLTGLPIDSATTRYEGTGGAYMVNLGTGFAVVDKDKGNNLRQRLSFGVNAGYLFGKKDYSTKRTLNNDTVDYYQANYETRTTFGSIFFNVGAQYLFPIDTAKRISLSIGAYGNWGQKISSNQDTFRETFLFDDNLGELRLDSVSDIRDIKGKITLPSTFTVGFVLQKPMILEKDRREAGWMIGMDFNMQNWDQYRLSGQKDSVRNKWELRVGGQFNPIARKSYFSNITYRAGFFMGPDYIQVGKKLPTIGGTFGLGLPVALSRQAPYQITLINVALEYIKRGNTSNILRENTFRFSLGFSLSDFWFGKRKYD